jgi:hypothetical protein
MELRRGQLQRRAAVRIALVLLPHLALLWMATRPVPRLVAPDNRVWVQLAHSKPPPMSLHKNPVTEPVRAPQLDAAGRVSPRATEPPVASPSSVAPGIQAPQMQTPESPEERALLGDAAITKKAESTPPADSMQQALKAVGAIDRQLRAEHRQEFSAPPDTPRARLSRGLEAAHAAVKPKWFQAARTELISAPNDPRRIYRVTTAMGEHCLYFPDKGSISANSDPRSGLAGFGQPTVSSCPIPF